MFRTIVPVCAAALACLSSTSFGAEPAKSTNLPLPVAMEELPSGTRDMLAKVMKSPTLSAVGPAEEFVAHPDMYQWLLDHPDRTAAAWRKLGVDAVQIKMLKDGRFCWKDENGSELTWQNVAQGPTGRIWYAEGKVKPALLLPTVPVKAVAVLSHSERARRTGDYIITHQLQIYLQSDNKAAKLVTKMFGETAPKMAEQGSEQLLMFFSGIAKYAHDKPEKAKSLLAESEK
jgi:hypothetical protein